MSIQYVSDIHLEFHDKQNKGAIHPEMFVTPVAPYLVLAGDIGIPDLKSYSVFLKWCSQKWKRVFLVAGNHEYYNIRVAVKSDIPTRKKLIQTICEGLPNVDFLDCTSVYVPELKLRILGCTLWSDIPDCVHDKVITYMHDSKQILEAGTKNFLPASITEVHQKEKQWLNQEIHKCELTNERCLVITHYLPSYSLIHEKYEGHFLNACFASDCDDLIRPPVVGWICGHSHTGMKRKVHGIPCVLNPYGYPDEGVETRNRAAVLTL